MPTAHKLPSGSWRCQVLVRGVRRSVTGETKRAAEIAAADLLRAEADASSAFVKYTFGQAVDRYLEDKSRILSPSTLYAYKKIRQVNLQPIAQIKLTHLTGQDIQRLINTLSADHSPKTVRNIWGLISATLKYCRPDLKPRIHLPAPRPKEMEIPDSAQLPALLERCAHYPELHTAVILAATCGLRLSEICALTWEDVDLAVGRLTVSKALVRGTDGSYTLKQPKSLAGHRVITIPAATLAYLKTLPQDHPTLITVTPRAISAAFENARDALGLRCRFHDLRHYYASVLLALGVPNKYSMALMGHSTAYTLEHVYQHLMRDKQDAITTQLDGHFDALLPSSALQKK